MHIWKLGFLAEANQQTGTMLLLFTTYWSLPLEIFFSHNLAEPLWTVMYSICTSAAYDLYQYPVMSY